MGYGRATRRSGVRSPGARSGGSPGPRDACGDRNRGYARLSSSKQKARLEPWRRAPGDVGHSPLRAKRREGRSRESRRATQQGGPARGSCAPRYRVSRAIPHAAPGTRRCPCIFPHSPAESCQRSASDGAASKLSGDLRGMNAAPGASVSTATVSASSQPRTGQAAGSGLLLYLAHLGLRTRAPGRPGCPFHSYVGKEIQLPRSAVSPGDSQTAMRAPLPVRSWPRWVIAETPPVQPHSPRPPAPGTTPPRLNTREQMVDVVPDGPTGSSA
jgi:hypothetical protein